MRNLRISQALSFYCLATILFCFSTLGFAAEPEIGISGVEEEIADNIRAHLALSDESCSVAQRRLRLLVGTADEDIARALRALGYYHASWQKDLLQEEDCWSLNIVIDPGEPVIIERATVEVIGQGKDQLQFVNYLEALPVEKGQRLDHGRYEKMKSDLQGLAQQYGYFDARFVEHRIEVNTQQNKAYIRLLFDTEARYQFGAISYELDGLNETLIDRFRTFLPGDPFDVDALLSFQQRLSDSRYFQNVNVLQQSYDEAALVVPILVQLEVRPKYAYVLGGGFATDTGPRGSLEFNNRRVNKAGHRFTSKLNVSPVRSNLSFDYEIPLSNPLKEKINFNAGWQIEDTDTSESELYTFGASISETFANRWVNTFSVDYQKETFEVANQERTTDLLMPGVALNTSYSNDFAYPTRGWKLNTSLRGALEGVISDVSLIQLRAGAKYIRSFGRGRVLTRVDIGSTMMGDFDELPASLRFFAGGDNSVRGYGYEELGPSDENGEVIGGKHMITASIEYDYPLWNNYGVAVFYDMGNAFDTDQFHLSRGAGIGFRWRSPIGPIRIDIAVPVDDNGVRLHLSMGPDI